MPDIAETVPPDGESYVRFVSALVLLGREQIQGQLDGSKQFDTKSLGLLTACGAFASFVATNQSGVGSLWGWALAAAGLSIFGCIATLFGKDYDKGPDLRKAYNRYAAQGPEPLAFLVAELDGTVRFNVEVAEWKSWAFRWAAGWLVVALLVVGLSAVRSKIHL